jgi:hypothetical protein
VTGLLGKPVRLTFPDNGTGFARIMADGKHQTGHVIAEESGWRAHLWDTADVRPDDVRECETVTGEKLADLRRVLRERVELKGPWWQ